MTKVTTITILPERATQAARGGLACCRRREISQRTAGKQHDALHASRSPGGQRKSETHLRESNELVQRSVIDRGSDWTTLPEGNEFELTSSVVLHPFPHNVAIASNRDAVNLKERDQPERRVSATSSNSHGRWRERRRLQPSRP